MAGITARVRAARTVVRAKTTPYTALHAGWTFAALTLFAYLTWPMDLPMALALAAASTTFYGAGRYAGLAHAWTEEKPYRVELKDGEELPECTCLDR